MEGRLRNRGTVTCCSRPRRLCGLLSPERSPQELSLARFVRQHFVWGQPDRPRNAPLGFWVSSPVIATSVIAPRCVRRAVGWDSQPDLSYQYLSKGLSGSEIVSSDGAEEHPVIIGLIKAFGEDVADCPRIAGDPRTRDRALRRSSGEPLLVGDRSIGEILFDHPTVALVSATGSTRMGREVWPRLAHRFARSILELGGNNAGIVCPSADLDMALSALAFGAMGTPGQRCNAAPPVRVGECLR